MKYMAQIRTRRYDQSWTHWQTIGDPMSQAEADEWLSFDHVVDRYEQAKGPTERKIEFRLIVVPEDWPTIFRPRLVKR